MRPAPTARPAGTSAAIVPTLDEVLIADPDQFVAKYTDIAAVNLACARGLPNCDEREFPKYLALLDTIAEAVKRQTEKNFRLFKLKPKQFNNSEAVFRLYTMEHVFRIQFGIKYDPKVREVTQGGKPWTSDDSSELFIHGLLNSKRTGTCSSLPTFAIAVGRRLGYPLKLVLVPNHTLYRWDDGKEVFNLQPTEAGGEVRTDESFHEWPRKWDEIDYEINARTKVWLHSLTPRKEASKFLCNRALMLRDTGRYEEALAALTAARRFDPINPAVADIEYSILIKSPTGVLPGAEAPAPVGDVFMPAVSGNRPPLVGGLVMTTGPEPSPVQAEFNTGPAWSTGTVIRSFTAPPPSSTSSQPAADRRRREEADFADEHVRLVQLINESNRNRSPQHPNGNPPTGPLMRQLTQLLQSWKGQ